MAFSFSEMLVVLNAVQPAPSSLITRGYVDVINFSLTITNMDTQFDIPAVSPPWQNFNASMVCSDRTARRKRSLGSVHSSVGAEQSSGNVEDARSTLYSERELDSSELYNFKGQSRAKRTAVQVGPFIASADDGSLLTGVFINESITLNISVGILLPRDTCEDLVELCMSIEPATGASYSLAPGDSHIRCIDLTPYKNCIGESIYTDHLLTMVTQVNSSSILLNN